jgi:hypothetical protein
MTTKKTSTPAPSMPRHLAPNEVGLLKDATPRIVSSIGRLVLGALPANALVGVGDVEALAIGGAVLAAVERTQALLLLDGTEARLAKRTHRRTR